jgi:predicted deacylase
MDVGGVSLPPKGSVHRHSVELVELPDGLRVQLPLLLVSGVKDGPRLYLGAGIHGDEVGGVAIVTRALAQVDPTTLAGSIVCIPVQNPLALHADHRLPLSQYLRSPLDLTPIDPWSCFPGDPEGNLSERLAHRLFGFIQACDFAIDVHTPTRGGRYVPIAILPSPSAGPTFAAAEALGEALGAGYIMKTKTGMYVRDGVLSVEAARAGVPAFTFEIGEGGRLEPEIVLSGAQCVLNALRYLHMVPGDPEPLGQIVRLREFIGLRAHRGGLLVTEAPLGARVRTSQPLARIFSIYGDELEVVTSPVDGVFVRATTLSTVSVGDRVATVGLIVGGVDRAVGHGGRAAEARREP